MDDFDLQTKIRSIRAPRHGGEYWDGFSEKVLAELRKPAARRAEPKRAGIEFAWTARMALACAVIGFCLVQSKAPRTISHLLRKDEAALRKDVQTFHNNLGLLMRDAHGMDDMMQ